MAGTGGDTLPDGINDGSPGANIGDGVGRQIKLEQAHRAFDVDANRARIDVRGGDQHAADRRTVTGMRIGIEHKFGDAWG